MVYMIYLESIPIFTHEKKYIRMLLLEKEDFKCFCQMKILLSLLLKFEIHILVCTYFKGAIINIFGQFCLNICKMFEVSHLT